MPVPEPVPVPEPGWGAQQQGCRKELGHSTQSTFTITITNIVHTSMWSIHIPYPSSTHGGPSTQCRC